MAKHFSDDKNLYSAFAETRPKWPVFMQAWWLDVVCGGREGWSCALMLDGSGQILAALPYFLEKKGPIRRLKMPPLTPWLLVWARQDAGQKASTDRSKEKEAIAALLNRLPEATFFQMNFHWSMELWLPFVWAGFRPSVRLTHVIDCSTGPASLWSSFQKKVRNRIRKAEGLLSVSNDGSMAEIHFLLQKRFAPEKKEPHCSLEMLQKIDDAFSTRSQRAVFFARDAEKRLHAAVFLVWDGSSADLLISASDPELRKSGAVYLLFWAVLKFLSHREDLPSLLDFEGSMDPKIESVYRAFGAEPRTYLQFFRAKNRFLAAAAAFFGKG